MSISSIPPDSSPPLPGDVDRRSLGRGACLALVLGNIVGIGIFLTPGGVARASENLWVYGMFWILGGLVALAGALVYAELGTLHPRAGGEYVFLDQAYGRPVAYAWGWMSALIVFPGSIAALFIWVAGALSSTRFGQFLNLPVFSIGEYRFLWSDAAAMTLVWLTTAINCRSVRATSWLQTVLTWIPLSVLLVAGVTTIATGGSLPPSNLPDSVIATPSAGDLSAAFCKVFWAYTGWNVLVYLGGEIKRPEKNIPTAVVLALAATLSVYLLLNLAFLSAFPLQKLPSIDNVGLATAERMFGPLGGEVFAVVITLAAIAGMNVTTMAGSRISLAMARDGYLWRKMAWVHPRRHTPVVALLIQGGLSSLLVLTKSADMLITVTGSVMLLLSCVTVSTLFVFRRRKTAVAHYRAFGFPFLPAFFILVGALVIGAGLTAESRTTLIGLALFLALMAANYLSNRIKNRPRPTISAAGPR